MSGILPAPSARVFKAAALVLGTLLSNPALAEARTLDTRFGELSIDGEAARVVTLYEGALDTSFAVGIAPLGAVATRGGDGVASYMQDKADGVAIVSTAREINLESVIALQPDLILASSSLPEEQYRLLSAVAPTVVADVDMFQDGAWKEEARLFARALNREAELDKVLAELDQRTAGLAQRFEQSVPADGRKASLARWMPQGAMMMSSRLFTSSLLKAVGFDMQDGGIVKEGLPHSSPLSQENLSLVDGNWLFLATLNHDGREALAAAEQSPAFARLKVVQQQRVFPVDGQIWTSATGPLAAHAILDDVERALEQAAR
ncbi:ABC transporter substrate-binding protein [Zobellella iuensis]|uniref:Iron-siderophore ABC transporter substrate-binding protein n=1 Tax=Zobellella iuensis TaxID=2803811 RepID=A0ABS1QQ12_9GAMM|nr:iron-siderophore ABC transporter substrate-binding protein [Zobellella iuensis]MBL1376963.1 iron-siderophore ABC transporter substrate-binding protein [Zobellella iuensis]